MTTTQARVRLRGYGLAVLALAIGAASAACGGGMAGVTSSSPPLSRQVTFVESTSTGETMLRATGKGTSVPRALVDARKAALWFVLHAGDRKLLTTPADEARATAIEPDLYAGAGQFVRYESRLMSKRRIGGLTQIEVVLRLDIAAIKARLAAAGVQASVEQTAEKVGLPSIAVLGKAGNGATAVAVATLQEYLQDRNFEVFVLDAGASQDAGIAAIAALEGIIDPAYALALGSKADIYITVEARGSVGGRSGITTRTAAVVAGAYETATGRGLGTSTGHSPERAVTGLDAITQEAANDAADKVTASIRKEWAKQVTTGRAFKVIAMTDGASGGDFDQALYGVLKGLSKRPVRRLGSGETMSSYVVYVHDMANAFELFGALRRKWRGPGSLSKVRDVGGLLVLKGGDGGTEIEIK